jgi:hypothetical protein
MLERLKEAIYRTAESWLFGNVNTESAWFAERNLELEDLYSNMSDRLNWEARMRMTTSDLHASHARQQRLKKTTQPPQKQSGKNQ